MAQGYKNFGKALTGGSAEALFTVGVGMVATIRHLNLCNTLNLPLTVRVHRVPVGRQAGTDNAAMYDYSIPGKDFKNPPLVGMMLMAGERLMVSGSGPGVTVLGSYVETPE